MQAVKFSYWIYLPWICSVAFVKIGDHGTVRLYNYRLVSVQDPESDPFTLMPCVSIVSLVKFHQSHALALNSNSSAHALVAVIRVLVGALADSSLLVRDSAAAALRENAQQYVLCFVEKRESWARFMIHADDFQNQSSL